MEGREAARETVAFEIDLGVESATELVLISQYGRCQSAVVKSASLKPSSACARSAYNVSSIRSSRSSSNDVKIGQTDAQVRCKPEYQFCKNIDRAFGG